MPSYPFTESLSPETGRRYYGPSLTDPRTQSPLWITQEPRSFYEDTYGSSRLAYAAAGAAALVGLGYVPTGSGRRVWDYYARGFRMMEEYSPAGILRTFQASNFLSQFEAIPKKGLFIPGSQLEANRALKAYFEGLIGPAVGPLGKTSSTSSRLSLEGLQLREGRLYWGTSEQVALQHAAIIKTPEETMQRLGAAWSRILGKGPTTPESYFSRAYPVPGNLSIRNPVVEGMPGTVVGGHTRLQFATRWGRAWGTELVSRFNRLLGAPFEMQPFKSMFGGIQRGFRSAFNRELQLKVEEGTGLQMLGRLSWKYGALVPSIYMGYQTLDWMARQSDLLEGSIFSEGITTAVATVGVQANLLASRIAEASGLQKYRELQEDTAPGSTSLQKLLAFPLMGALAGAGGLYAWKVGLMAKGQLTGKIFERTLEDRSSAGARVLAEEIIGGLGEKFALGRLGRRLTREDAPGAIYGSAGLLGKIWRKIAEPVPEKTGALTFKFLGEVGSSKLSALAGGAIGTGMILPFLPGALIPETSPDELRRIYSGEQEVAVRRGRWWEFGRCLTKTTTYRLKSGEIKTSDQIKIGDQLVGPQYETAVVKGIYTRHHTGEVRRLFTAHDRDIETGLTTNHIVPVLRDNVLQEVEAGDIQINEYVHIPVRELEHSYHVIEVPTIIKTCVFVQDDRVFSAQRNWYSGHWQKSGKHSVPCKLELDYDLGLLFGYFLAEGNISFNGENPTIIETVHAKSEYNYVLDIQRIIFEKFGTQATVRFKTTGKKTKEGCWIVRICSAILAKLFRCLFYPEQYDSQQKRIPEQFLQAGVLFQKGLIEGYWRGDGHYDGKSRVITSARKWLLVAIQTMALDHGNACGISRHSKGQFNAWRLRFYDKNATNPGSKFVNGKLYARIREIQVEDYDDTVYDFEVDHPDHLLQAGTFLVHNSPYEGRKVAYYRPHWYARMRMRAKEASIWGEEAEELSPIERWLKQEFTYDLEQKHYESRPYPVTGLPFEDVPLVGPILAGTIGRLIKPPKLMHTEKWAGEEGLLASPRSFGQRVATEIGQEPGTAPISPYGARGVTGEQVYRLQEMIGLPGFAMMTLQEQLKGTPDWFDQMQQLESARRMYGFERTYWDLELGGLLGTTEAFRRLYPHRRRQIPLYNPIRNLMPEWLPGPGEKSPDFLHGDPFTKIQEGELRLPGAGYAVRYPELKGIRPDDYPLIHRFKILADVAPYTQNFKDHLSMVRRARVRESWDESQERIYQQTLEQLQARKEGMKFQKYEYLSPMGEVFGEKTYYSGEDSAGLIAKINEIKAQKTEEEGTGVFSRLFGGYWELLAHNAETALDQVTPVSPGAKLVHVRTPIEAYERLQVYGTENAFWNHPVRDFFKPSMWLGARTIGYEGIPEGVQQKRELEEYFDILKYVKYSRLSNLARLEKDYTAVKEFEARKDQTLFGVSPFTRNYRSIFRALPRRERDYFNAFAEAETEEERTRILELVPENERSLYTARWKLAFADEVRRARKAGLLSDAQLEEADEQIQSIYDEARTEGFPSSKELFAEYVETRYPGESYPDWYRRVKLLHNLPSIPGPDWVGWHPSVDLEDVKLKIVMNMGEDMHDYDLWPSQAQTLINKPYINQAAIEAVMAPEELTPDEIHDRIDTLFLTDSMRAGVFTRTAFGIPGDHSIDVDIEDGSDNRNYRRDYF